MGRETDNSKKRILANLTITLQGKQGAISIGKNVAKALGVPNYVALRISYKNKSLLILPCEQQDVMSYEMPKHFLESRNVGFRIYSLSFVTELLRDNGLNTDSTYLLEGRYSNQIGAIFFPIETAKPITEEEHREQENDDAFLQSC